MSITVFYVFAAKISKVSKGAKIRNRYNQVPHLRRLRSAYAPAQSDQSALPACSYQLRAQHIGAHYLSIFRYVLTPEGDVRRVFWNKVIEKVVR